MSSSRGGSGRDSEGRWLGYLLPTTIQILGQIAINIPIWYISSSHDLQRRWFETIVAGTLIGAAAAMSIIVAQRSWHGPVQQSAGTYERIALGVLLIVAAEVVAVAILPARYRSAVYIPWWAQLAFYAFAILLLNLVVYALDAPGRANILDILSRRVFGQPLAPGFGVLGRDVSAADLLGAVPATEPPASEASGTDEPGTTTALAHATAWAEALRRTNSLRNPPVTSGGPYATTIGFVRLRDQGVKLAVVNYFLPRRLLRAWIASPRTIVVAGQDFPVVSRPWLPTPHRGPTLGDGHCWVILGEDPRRYGVLTCRHSLKPRRARPGATVYVRSARSRISGTLRESSIIMDAALVEIDESSVPELSPAPHSRVPGFKPVRLCPGHEIRTGQLNGKITGMPGFDNAVYSRQRGGEPRIPALMTFDFRAERGDSGCVILDLEGESRGYTDPYLIYQGIGNYGRGTEGLGIYIQQIADHWSFETQLAAPWPASLPDSPLNRAAERNAWHDGFSE